MVNFNAPAMMTANDRYLGLNRNVINKHLLDSTV